MIRNYIVLPSLFDPLLVSHSQSIDNWSNFTPRFCYFSNIHYI